MRRKGVVKTRHREVRSAERVVDSEGRTGRSGDRVVDSESQICRQNVVVTPRAEQAEVPTSMACLVLVKKRKKRKRERESQRAREREIAELICSMNFLHCWMSEPLDHSCCHPLYLHSSSGTGHSASAADCWGEMCCGRAQGE